METFLGDYVAGAAEGRYIDAELPTLPFPDASFDLALSSHFLFLYSAQLGEEFHVMSLIRFRGRFSYASSSWLFLRHSFNKEEEGGLWKCGNLACCARFPSGCGNRSVISIAAPFP